MEIIDEEISFSTQWVEELAFEELNMDSSGVVNINGHLDPTLLLEESSINFMNKLRELFEVYTNRFNECRGENGSVSSIKVFKISNRKANDLITIGFISNGNDIFSARLSNSNNNDTSRVHEIKANIGPFNKISWCFQGEVVDLDSLVRHYLAEFIRNSAR